MLPWSHEQAAKACSYHILCHVRRLLSTKTIRLITCNLVFFILDYCYCCMARLQSHWIDWSKRRTCSPFSSLVITVEPALNCYCSPYTSFPFENSENSNWLFWRLKSAPPKHLNACVTSPKLAQLMQRSLLTFSNASRLVVARARIKLEEHGLSIAAPQFEAYYLFGLTSKTTYLDSNKF